MELGSVSLQHFTHVGMRDFWNLKKNANSMRSHIYLIPIRTTCEMELHSYQQ